MSSLAVFVAGISPEAHVDDLVNLFSFCGKLKHVTFAPEKADSHFKEAIIEFENAGSFETALLLDQAILKNKPISVSAFEPTRESIKLLPEAPPSPAQIMASPPLPPRHVSPQTPSTGLKYNDPKLIFVSNLTHSVDAQLLQKFFAFCGPIQNIGLHSSSGTALVEFRLAKSIAIAKVMAGSILGGDAINVEPFNPTRHGTSLFDSMYMSYQSSSQAHSVTSAAPPPLPPRRAAGDASSSSSGIKPI